MNRRHVCSALTVLLAASAGVVGVTSASAHTPRPDKPAGVHIVASTRSSFTVELPRVAHTGHYVLFVSRDDHDVFYTNINRSRPSRVEVASSTPLLTVSGLHYTTANYYYRVEARNGSRFQLSNIREAHVRPAAPNGVNLSAHHMTLSWHPGSAIDYDVVQATNPAFTQHRKRYRLRGQATEFTPYGLHNGRRYYFKVRARNNVIASSSHYIKAGSIVCTHREQRLSVLTYNVLHAMFDGTRENGNRIASWKKRLPKILGLIRSSHPDVLSIQEASDWVVPEKRRTIDTINARLKGYALAHTEHLPNPRTGNYILYKTSEYRSAGPGGHWALSHKNWAAYKPLQNRHSGAKFLMVALHLSHGPNSVNARRTREATRLVAGARARAHGMPIVYAGDFNSFSGPDKANLDGPMQVMRSDHIADGYVEAQFRHHLQYGSVNDYTRIPSHSGRVIDHVFGGPGVAMRTWRQVVHLRHGRFHGVIPSDHNPVRVGISVRYR